MKKNGYSLEMLFGDVFPEDMEEEERLKGGSYRKKFIPIEEIPAVMPDMESVIDAMREKSVLTEDFEEERDNRDVRWDDFYPTSNDLLPFHMTMASADEDFTQPGFSAFLSERAHRKTTYHRGGRIVCTRKIAPFEY